MSKKVALSELCKMYNQLTFMRQTIIEIEESGLLPEDMFIDIPSLKELKNSIERAFDYLIKD